MIKTICDRCGNEKGTKHYVFPMLNTYYAQNRGRKLASFSRYEDVEVDLCRECELILANVITACIDEEKE